MIDFDVESYMKFSLSSMISEDILKATTFLTQKI